MIRHMEKEHIHMQMEHIIPAIGWRISNMEKEWNHGLMVLNMKDSTMMVRNMERAN